MPKTISHTRATSTPSTRTICGSRAPARMIRPKLVLSRNSNSASSTVTVAPITKSRRNGKYQVGWKKGQTGKQLEGDEVGNEDGHAVPQKAACDRPGRTPPGDIRIYDRALRNCEGWPHWVRRC